MLDLKKAHEALADGKGEGVTIAILDTGLDASHPFFQNATILPQVSFDLQLNAIAGKPEDPVGHGTAIAGIIHRLVPQAGLLPIQVLRADSRQHRHEIIASGALHAIGQGADILNCSFGSPATAPNCLLYKKWLDQAFDAGRHVVTATSENPFPEWPSAFRTSFAVSNSEEKLATWASIGGQPHAFQANGTEIEVPSPGGGFATLTGSSFAAAHFSAMIAKLLCQQELRPPFLLHEALRQLGNPDGQQG